MIDIKRDVGILANKIKLSKKKFTSVYPIPMGGYPVAIELSVLLDIPIAADERIITGEDELPNTDILVVDDLIDSGKTIDKYLKNGNYIATLYNKNTKLANSKQIFFAEQKPQEEWIRFPWERETSIEDNIVRIFQYIGEDPERPGIKDTPKRVVKMYNEIFRGYKKELLPNITVFDNGSDGVAYDQLITDSGDFYSNCEHHMVPFFGKYWFAYIPHPKGKVIGLSKVARVVDYYSAKLQIQERLGSDIINCLWNALSVDTKYKPLGMGIIMQGEHLCKTMRGAKKKGTMTTSSLLGNFKTNDSVKQEFLKLIKL